MTGLCASKKAKSECWPWSTNSEGSEIWQKRAGVARQALSPGGKREEIACSKVCQLFLDGYRWLRTGTGDFSMRAVTLGLMAEVKR